MKLIIASDIHGSAYYCKKLVEVINKENPETVEVSRFFDISPKAIIISLSLIGSVFYCVLV